MKSYSITRWACRESQSDIEVERDGDLKTTKTLPCTTTLAAKFLAMSVLCLVILQASLSHAQTQAQPQNQTKLAKLDEPGKPSSENAAEAKRAETPAAAPAPDPGVSSSDIAKELAVMKARIEQLEAELKGRAATAPTSSTVVAEPKVTPVAASAAQTTESASTAASVDPAAAQARTSLPEKPKPTDPFAYADWTWLNGNPRNKDVVWDSKFFTPEIRMDIHYIQDLNHPRDDSMGGSTEIFRSNEIQVEQISFGGNFHWQNVNARILTMNGMFGVTTPRNDASAGRGQWDLRSAYKYVSEANAGYHFNVNHGLNIDAGIFVSYIGLFSYYNFDNWAYQPSYVSSNTPWFFNGLRIQWFPTDKLKIEPWIINGWQSYGRLGSKPGLGGQILYRPTEWLSLVFNNYGNGTDALGFPGRVRLHTDDSILVRYYNNPENTGLSKIAISLTGDLGCEYGGGVTCHGGKGGPKQAFLGWMVYNRFWFHKDLFAITPGGGMMNNPGRYLTLLPPINGADAISGSPYFTTNPGDKAHMWDATVTLQYMPKQYITWWAETGYRHADIPYFTGRGGITPPGGNTGSPSQYVC